MTTIVDIIQSSKKHLLNPVLRKIAHKVISRITLVVVSLLLVTIFPFCYSHLADTLPIGIQFVLAWVTGDIARIVLMLQVVIGIITAITVFWRYVTFKNQ